MEIGNKMDKITTCISTNNNIDYLKLAIKSVRQNAYYEDMPIIIHTENCTDGTDKWLESLVLKKFNRFYILNKVNYLN